MRQVLLQPLTPSLKYSYCGPYLLATETRSWQQKHSVTHGSKILDPQSRSSDLTTHVDVSMIWQFSVDSIGNM